MEVLCYSVSSMVYGNAVVIRNGIMFDFYPGLPHIPSSIVLPIQSTTLLYYSMAVVNSKQTSSSGYVLRLGLFTAVNL